MTKEQALMSLRPNAQWVLGADGLQWMDTEQTQPTEAEIEAEMAKEFIDPASAGNQKLLDLGLTQEEATALTGYTPPVE